MRLAVFSDVHGNLAALEAVLADIEAQAPDLVFFAGDLCLWGARPAECLRRVYHADISCIYGNTDLALGDQPLLSDDIAQEERARREAADDIIGWTWAQLTEMERAWLRELPFHRRVSPTVQPRDDLFMVHANPKNADDPIHPAVAQQKELYGQVEQTDEELVPLLGDLQTGVLAFGHVHIPGTRPWKGLLLANISSVSLPLDGDPRAKYGLCTWQPGTGWTIEHRRVDYDLQEEIAVLGRIRPPRWQELQRRLQNATDR